MHKYVFFAGLMIIAIVGVINGGCSGSNTPTTPTSTSTPPTAGELAQAGQSVFANRCASCHGADGQGGTAPAVIGASAHLGEYNTAQGLLGYVETNMPALNPGSLSHQEYLNIVAYLLIQNGDLSADASFDETRLGDISLE